MRLKTLEILSMQRGIDDCVLIIVVLDTGVLSLGSQSAGEDQEHVRRRRPRALLEVVASVEVRGRSQEKFLLDCVWEARRDLLSWNVQFVH